MDAGPEKAFLSVVLPEDLKRWVRVEAAHRDMSASAYVRELVLRERGDPNRTSTVSAVGKNRLRNS